MIKRKFLAIFTALSLIIAPMHALAATDDTTPPPTDTTTPPADTTTPPADTTTPPADTTTPPADTTTPPADDTTTPPPADDTTPPADGTTPPPTEDPTTPPAGDVCPPTDDDDEDGDDGDEGEDDGDDDTTTPPADDTTPPPADDTTPPADDTTTPPADTTTPPADDTTTPPADDTTTPPTGDTTTIVKMAKGGKGADHKGDKVKENADKAKEAADKAKKDADKAKEEADKASGKQKDDAKKKAEEAKKKAEEAKKKAEQAKKKAEEAAKQKAKKLKEYCGKKKGWTNKIKNMLKHLEDLNKQVGNFQRKLAELTAWAKANGSASDLEALKQIEEALKASQEVEEAEPTDLVVLAEVQDQLNKVGDAVTTLEKALALDSTNTEVLKQLSAKQVKKGDKSVKVYVKGQKPTFDVVPVIKEGRTLVPLRAIGESLDAEVQWDNATRTITLTNADGKVVTLQIDNKTATVDGQPVTLDVPASIEGGRTVVPLRALGEFFGLNVQWDGAAQMAVLNEK